ncbi:MAG: LysR family transcriptional regulator [Pedobacter sp.]|jgi:DNA-binding transcriptional LysR family regulator|uniref:LysR family transcriptional regulator n=1 Tax=Pedobacter sp. TaxID=1411316 RepID=UPI0035626B31
MQINDFVIFQAVAEYNSFTKAATITNTVQSNVTARIKYLEEQFNARLFNRTSRQIELTEAGLQLLKATKEIQVILDHARKSIGGKLTAVKGLIKIGCIHTTAALRAPGILKKFTEEYPQIEFRLKTGTSASLIKDVISYKLDGAFVAGNVNHHDLIVQEILSEELCIVTSTGITSINQLKKSVKPLRMIAFSDGCSYRKLFEDLLNEWPTKKFTILEQDTLEGIINTVEAGIGITLLPIALIEKYYSYRNLNTISLPKKFAQMKTVYVKRKDAPMSESYLLFYKMIEEGYKL